MRIFPIIGTKLLIAIRKEVVLDHVKVPQDHFHSFGAKIHLFGDRKKMQKDRLQSPSERIFPIVDPKLLDFARKEVVLDHLKVPQDHFHSTRGHFPMTAERKKEIPGHLQVTKDRMQPILG